MRGRIIHHFAVVYVRSSDTATWEIERLEVNARTCAFRVGGKFAKLAQIIDAAFHEQCLADPVQREMLEDRIQAIHLDALVTSLARAEAQVAIRMRDLEADEAMLPQIEATLLARAQARPSAVATLIGHEPDACRRDYLMQVVVPTLPDSEA